MDARVAGVSAGGTSVGEIVDAVGVGVSSGKAEVGSATGVVAKAGTGVGSGLPPLVQAATGSAASDSATTTAIRMGRDPAPMARSLGLSKRTLISFLGMDGP